MKFWPRNVLQMMDNERDKAFLQSMMSDRKALMSGKDNIAFSRVNRKLAEKTKNPSEKRNGKMSQQAAVLPFSVTVPLQIPALMTK